MVELRAQKRCAEHSNHQKELRANTKNTQTDDKTPTDCGYEGVESSKHKHKHKHKFMHLTQTCVSKEQTLNTMQ